jgi:hypothetical protein
MWRSLSAILKRSECDRTRSRLSAYIDQRLGAQEQKELEKHLEACQVCREELDSLKATVRLLHVMPQALPGRSFAVTEARPLPRWSPAPALCMATAVVAVFLVLAFAADMANLFESSAILRGEKGQSSYGSQQDDGSSDSQESPSKGNGATLDFLDGDQEGATNEGGGATGESEGGTLVTTEAGWVRPLEYSLLGGTVLLGGATIVALRGRRKAPLAATAEDVSR